MRLLTPVLGVLFIGFTVVSAFGSGNSPDSKASGARVIAWFVAHRHTERVTDILGIFAMLFFVFFAGSLLGYLRRAPAAATAAIVMFGGAATLAAGFTVALGIDYALADVPSHLAPSAAQALNVLDNDVFFTVPLGGAVFAIPAGIAILRGGALPKWLGWAAIVIGIVLCSPAFFPAFLVLLIWALIVSILIYLRSATVTPTPAAAVSAR
jgi:hypothetical protein